MADKRPGQKIKMTSIDELLCVPDSSGTTEISVRDIYPFENHPFKVLDDDKMAELIESIKENGVLTPVIVRKDRDEKSYIYQGEEIEISRKSALSEQMSRICDEIFSQTPVINNEAINKNDITAMAGNSRNKIVTALLRNELEPNLGLTGSGQEVWVHI